MVIAADLVEDWFLFIYDNKAALKSLIKLLFLKKIVEALSFLFVPLLHIAFYYALPRAEEFMAVEETQPVDVLHQLVLHSQFFLRSKCNGMIAVNVQPSTVQVQVSGWAVPSLRVTSIKSLHAY